MSMLTIDFSREIPLFPLPNLVLLPSAVQALHIFEERYKEMMAAALAGQNLIAMALLKEGWMKEYHGTPAIHPVVCVGRIVSHETVEDGKYNLLLQGMLRAGVLRERKQGTYRVGRLEPLADLPVDEGREAIHRAALSEMFTHGAYAQHAIAKGMRDLLGHSVPVSAIADILAFSILQDVGAKQRLLEERNPNVRADAMIGILAEMSKAGAVDGPKARAWPPAMGEN